MDIRRSSVRLILLVTTVAVGVTRCAGDPISDSVEATVARGPGTRLVLAEHTQAKWDKVCVFGPYTPDEEVDAVAGIPGASKRAFDIRSNEGINVLMFIEGGQVAASVAHSRGRGDFGPELVRKCYSTAEAVFGVRELPAGSWGNIGPLSQSSR